MTKKQPEIVSLRDIKVDIAEITTAPNGIKLHKIDCTDENVLRFSLVFKAGTVASTKSFVASATANLLSEGTRDYTSHEIAEMLDFYGSNFDVSMDRDYVVITFCCLSKFFEQTLNIARQILLHPAFHEEEVHTYCMKRKQRLIIEQSMIAFKARVLFSAGLFGKNHPYGTSSDASNYDNVTKDDIVNFYNSYYVAENCFAVCSGNIPQEVEESILALCGDIRSGEKGAEVQFPEVQSERHVFQHHEGAVQSSIRIGKRLFTRSHPDFVAMQILTVILGGYFGSRLVNNLREQRGYTYGAFSGVINLEHDGYIAIATDVRSDATEDSIAQIFYEMDRLRTELVPLAELNMVRNIITGEILRILDAPFGISDVTIENIQNKEDNSYVTKMLNEVFVVTPEQIMEIAKKYFTPEEFIVVVVGAESSFED